MQLEESLANADLWRNCYDNGEPSIFLHNVKFTFELQDTMECIMEYYETGLNGNMKITNTETYP